MNQKRILLQGALILTCVSFASRILGFFYRIFLSRMIGAEGMGLYQLVFPVYTLALSLTSSGIETAISKHVSERMALGDEEGARGTFLAGLLSALAFSLPVSLLLYYGSSFIADTFLMEARCAELLPPLAFALPFSALHTCITGYYYGRKKTVIPSAALLLEQIVRIAVFLLLCEILLSMDMSITPLLAVTVLIFQEIASGLFILTALLVEHRKTSFCWRNLPFKSILSFCLPLTGNRLLINLLQSREAVLLPLCLTRSGLTSSASLSLYGILTGMALPLILFPSAISASVSTMLLPAISEAEAAGNHRLIGRTIRTTLQCTFALGFLCTLFFLCFGRKLGMLLFANSQVGDFLLVLSWICPFLYSVAALTGILHGLGMGAAIFRDSTITLVVRLLFVWFAVPILGIKGYLWGLLVSQIVSFLLSLYVLRNYMMPDRLSNR